jgi:hypothetical protein
MDERRRLAQGPVTTLVGRGRDMTNLRTVRGWQVIAAVICTLTVGATLTPSRSVAAILPRLFTTFTEHGSETINHFAVRPAESITDSADGGELRLHWTSWTATHATGYGRAYPDHGSWAFTVVASAPVTGDFPFPVFTRMKFVNHVPARGTVHDTLALAYLIGDALGWGELRWMENPESGAIVVRPPTPGGD